MQGSSALVGGQLFIMILEYLPECIRFYCVFTRAQTWGVFWQHRGEGERPLKAYSGSSRSAAGKRFRKNLRNSRGPTETSSVRLWLPFGGNYRRVAPFLPAPCACPLSRTAVDSRRHGGGGGIQRVQLFILCLQAAGCQGELEAEGQGLTWN